MTHQLPKTTPLLPGDESLSDRVVSNAFVAYAEYNKLLRTLFVTFGVGGAALLLTNDAIATKLSARGLLLPVATCLLVGAGAQVLLALVNKMANWYVYEAYVRGGDRNTYRLKCAEWLTSKFWIDLTLDILSIGPFGYALWKLLTVFVQAKAGSVP